MDNRELLVKEFVTNFKKNLNISVLYSRGHPLISKVVEDLKRSVDIVLQQVSPLKIVVSGDSLFCEGINFSDTTYVELSRRLHMHKIKSIEITRGVTNHELNYFVDLVSMSIKEIIQHRTDHSVQEKMAHLIIEEIDYYELLDQDTGEYKDVWGYLLAEAVDNKNSDKVSRLADNFCKTVKNFKADNLLEDSELRGSIGKFLGYLKATDKDKFPQCSKEVAKQILSLKGDMPETKVENIKTLFSSYSDNDLAEVLADNIVNAENFDNLSLGLFSRIVNGGKHSVVASLAAESLNEKLSEDKEKLQDKVKKLISIPDQDSVSQIYRNTLALFLKNISYSKNMYFDRDAATLNYRLILLHLLLDEKNKNSLSQITAEVMKVLESAIKSRDFEYISLLAGFLKKKKSEDESLSSAFVEMEKALTIFLEYAVLADELPEEYTFLLKEIKKSEIGEEGYIKKIFEEGFIGENILRFFFNFFPDSLDVFRAALEKKYSDIDFMQRAIRSFRAVNDKATLDLLKHVYNSANNYLKIEVLRAMQGVTLIDREFLLPILDTGDIVFKKEALLIMNQNRDSRHEAFAKLFYLKGHWWEINKVIMDNIIVVGELGLREAEDYLAEIGKKRFFWNRSIRNKAKEVLVKWQQQIK